MDLRLAKGLLISLLGYNILFFLGVGLSLVFPGFLWPIFIVFLAVSIPSVILVTYLNFHNGSLPSLESYLSFLLSFNALNIIHLAVISILAGLAYLPMYFLSPNSSIVTFILLLVAVVIFWPLKKTMARYYFRVGLYIFKSVNEDLEVGKLINRDNLAEELYPELGDNQGYLVTRFPMSIFIVSYAVMLGFYFFLSLNASDQYSLYAFIADNSNTTGLLLVNLVVAIITAYVCQKISVYVEEADDII